MIADAVRSELPVLRAEAEAMMVDSCIVTGSAESVWDENSGAYVPGVPAVLYEGRCRVQVPQAVPGQPVSGEAEWSTTVAVVSLPVVGSESVRVGASVEMTACEMDAALVGALFTIVGIPLAKSHATARRIRCERVTRG